MLIHQLMFSLHLLDSYYMQFDTTLRIFFNAVKIIQ